MKLPEGDILKQKWSLIKERFKTKSGLREYLLFSPLWAFILLKFYSSLYEFVGTFVAILKEVPLIGGILQWYVSLLIMGFLLILFNVSLNELVVRIYLFIMKLIKDAINKR